MTQHHRSIWVAALITPWAVPMGLNLSALLFGLFTKGLDALKGRDDLYLVFGYTLPATYTAMLVVGLPYVLWLRAHGVLTFFPVCIGAMIAAIVVSPAYVWILFRSTSLHAEDILVYTLFGLLSGIVFCLAAGITYRPSERAKDRAPLDSSVSSQTKSP